MPWEDRTAAGALRAMELHQACSMLGTYKGIGRMLLQLHKITEFVEAVSRKWIQGKTAEKVFQDVQNFH